MPVVRSEFHEYINSQLRYEAKTVKFFWAAFQAKAKVDEQLAVVRERQRAYLAQQEYNKVTAAQVKNRERNYS